MKVEALRLAVFRWTIEVGVRDGRIHAFAAVRSDTNQSLVFPQDLKRGDLTEALSKLDELATGAAFLLGHNLIDFDLLHLRAAKPELQLLKLPPVDTLRLNPLAFPRNPYHHLVKHYQDGQLKGGQLNDPYLDSQLTLQLFADQRQALRNAAPDLLTVWHWLSVSAGNGAGFDAFFSGLRRTTLPSDAEARAALRRQLEEKGCITYNRKLIADAQRYKWALAYALAWLSVSGGNSVMPPWVRHQFPETGLLVRRLRDTMCTDPACGWCRERHDAKKELKRWFGFTDFRLEPEDEDGQPMQQSIVETAMAREHVLGILPTGTGKSLCYQIPALSRYDKTGALTVVISPLVALMSDQVAGLEANGIGSCVAINGLLSLPERADALDQVRLGDAGILLISPEQLRNRSVRRVLEQREIGAWVLDEAHCISKWGHDFRPDYRYVARFIREKAGQQPVPPVLCLTATAKPDVVVDILRHLQDRLDIKMKVFDGGAQRANLEFDVIPTTGGEKFFHIHQVVSDCLSGEESGGAIASPAQGQSTTQRRRSPSCAAGTIVAHPPQSRLRWPRRGQRWRQPGVAQVGCRDGAGDAATRMDSVGEDRRVTPCGRRLFAGALARKPAVRESRHGPACRDNAWQAVGGHPIRPGAEPRRQETRQTVGERALLWLHEQEVIRLNKGLAVFRPAMTIRLNRDRQQRHGADQHFVHMGVTRASKKRLEKRRNWSAP